MGYTMEGCVLGFTWRTFGVIRLSLSDIVWDAEWMASRCHNSYLCIKCVKWSSAVWEKKAAALHCRVAKQFSQKRQHTLRSEYTHDCSYSGQKVLYQLLLVRHTYATFHKRKLVTLRQLLLGCLFNYACWSDLCRRFFWDMQQIVSSMVCDLFVFMWDNYFALDRWILKSFRFLQTSSCRFVSPPEDPVFP